ncbi:MAG: hypothetical protein AAGC57_16135 [Pseudomonadota bacterium]
MTHATAFLQAAERHLVAVGFRDPPEFRRRRAQPPGLSAPKPGAKPNRGLRAEVDRPAFAATLVLCIVVQVWPLLVLPDLGALARQQEGLVFDALGLAHAVLSGWAVVAVAALPGIVVIGAPAAWMAIRRHGTGTGLPGELAGTAFETNLFSIAVYAPLLMLLGASLTMAVGIGIAITTAGLVVAPLQGLIFGTIYQRLTRFSINIGD